MLTVPKDLQSAKTLFMAMHHLKQTNNHAYPVFVWMNEQLAQLDRDNRDEINEIIFRQRQGAAQAISQMLDYINKSRDEVVRFEGMTAT